MLLMFTHRAFKQAAGLFKGDTALKFEAPPTPFFFSQTLTNLRKVSRKCLCSLWHHEWLIPPSPCLKTILYHMGPFKTSGNSIILTLQVLFFHALIFFHIIQAFWTLTPCGRQTKTPCRTSTWTTPWWRRRRERRSSRRWRKYATANTHRLLKRQGTSLLTPLLFLCVWLCTSSWRRRSAPWSRSCRPKRSSTRTSNRNWASLRWTSWGATSAEDGMTCRPPQREFQVNWRRVCVRAQCSTWHNSVPCFLSTSMPFARITHTHRARSCLFNRPFPFQTLISETQLKIHHPLLPASRCLLSLPCSVEQTS